MESIAKVSDQPTAESIKAPFPWFGGKSRVAPIVWQYFGNVPNYVEPFAGSLAVLLGRPTEPKIETVNDADCYLANFWRAISIDPDAVARFADWPVNEADLTARHKWLVGQTDFRDCMKSDPDYYDAKIAGWWVWGLSAWIGGGWCVSGNGQLPHLNGAGMGVYRKLPHLGNAGKGVHRKLPHLGSAGEGIHRLSTRDNLQMYFHRLANRLRRVRVACGDWSRVLGDSPTVINGITGVFLDPPYASNRKEVYSVDSYTVAHDVRKWALDRGDNPLFRIALCGYSGEHEMPGWDEVAWKTQGGYGNQGAGKGRENRGKERIWFSPHCIPPVRQTSLF